MPLPSSPSSLAPFPSTLAPLRSVDPAPPSSSAAPLPIFGLALAASSRTIAPLPVASALPAPVAAFGMALGATLGDIVAPDEYSLVSHAIGLALRGDAKMRANTADRTIERYMTASYAMPVKYHRAG